MVLKKLLIVILLLIPLTSAIQWTDYLLYQGDTTQSQSRDLVINLPTRNGTSNNTYTPNYGFNSYSISSNTTYNSSNNAYEFNKSNKYLKMSSTILLDQETGFTISTWIKTPSNNTNAPIVGDNTVSTNRFFRWQISNSFYMEGNTNNQGCSADGVKFPNDVWAHFVVSVVNGNCTFYKDGNSVIQSDRTLNGNLSINSIGIMGDGGFIYLNGSISNVLIFNRSLSSVEINKLYSYGRVPNFNYLGSKDYLITPPKKCDLKCNRAGCSTC